MGLLFLCPNGLRLTAQRCRALAATLGKKRLVHQPQRGCVCFMVHAPDDTTASRFENHFLHLNQGSRQSAATLGFTVVAPLGQLMTE